jgi:hypothetical protein
MVNTSKKYLEFGLNEGQRNNANFTRNVKLGSNPK